ncbi:MAG: hypothetical protein ACRDIC_14020 [bacterium]
MSAARFARDVILGLSGFSVGMLIYLGAIELGNAIRPSWSPRFLATALVRFGTALTIGLVMEAVFRTKQIDWNWPVALYTLGLAMVLAGALGILVAKAHLRRE